MINNKECWCIKTKSTNRQCKASAPQWVNGIRTCSYHIELLHDMMDLLSKDAQCVSSGNLVLLHEVAVLVASHIKDEVENMLRGLRDTRIKIVI